MVQAMAAVMAPAMQPLVMQTYDVTSNQAQLLTQYVWYILKKAVFDPPASGGLVTSHTIADWLYGAAHWF